MDTKKIKSFSVFQYDITFVLETFINKANSEVNIMKIPKAMKRLCKKCKKHTEQKVTQTKKRTPSSLSKGSKYRVRKSGSARGVGSHGKYSRPAVTKFKRTGAKGTKKTDLRYTCNVCKKTSSQASGIRSKKVEFI